jgi:hypothetical protein
MKKLIITITGYLLFNIAYPQSPIGVNGIPSPNVTSLGVISEIPVSLYTGK